MNSLWSQYLAELPEHRKSTRSLRLSFQDLLMQPTCKTNTYAMVIELFSACIRSEHLERYVDPVQFYHLRKKNSIPSFLLKFIKSISLSYIKFLILVILEHNFEHNTLVSWVMLESILILYFSSIIRQTLSIGPR